MNEMTKFQPRDQTAAEVRAELDRSRNRLSKSADALRDEIKDGVVELRKGAHAIKDGMTLTYWVSKNPWGFVAGAFAIGFILSTRNRS